MYNFPPLLFVFDRLLEDLLKNGYQKLERPVSKESSPLQLNFSISLQQIIDLDEKNQLLTTNIWLTYNWFDANLSWNEVIYQKLLKHKHDKTDKTTEILFQSEYGGIEDIRIHPDRLWTPDMLMYNSASSEFDTTYPVNIIVESSGRITHMPPGIFMSTCKVSQIYASFWHSFSF